MILRSGKALIKRPKQGREDIISNLPEALLIHILSLLPDPVDAIRTCILSNRWKQLWVFLPNLYFVLPNSFESAEQVNKFHDSVDNALALRGGMPAQRFFLSCSQKYDYDRILNSLRIVLQSKLEILELRFPTDRYTNRIRILWDLFKACNTLIELTLKDVFMPDLPEADEFLFPCLKKINLISSDILGDQSLHNLISRCPVLQELYLERLRFLSQLQKIKISLPYLKRLRIQQCIFGCVFVIDAPKLEYFYIEDHMYANYSLKNTLSLVEAHINKRSCSVVELLTCISFVKVLTLACESLWAIRYLHGCDVLNIFPNLVKLDVDINCDWEYWHLLFILLNNMPLLEQFTISYGTLSERHMSWIPPVEAPACLRFKIKEILIINQEAVTQTEFILISYLLKHSSILETLTLNAHNIDHEGREQLLNFHRGSNMCQIKFI